MSTTEPNYRILVVDDVEDIHEDFKKILMPGQNEHYKHLQEMREALSGNVQDKRQLPPFIIDSAYQGTEALNLIKASLMVSKPYALAFVDVQMPPGMDGIDTIVQIWKLDPEIQIVICTAYSKYSWEEIFDKLGETDRLFILKKPFDQLEVINLSCSLTKKWNLGHVVTKSSVSPPPPTNKEPLEEPSGSSSQKGTDYFKDAINDLKALNEELKNNALFKKPKIGADNDENL